MINAGRRNTASGRGSDQKSAKTTAMVGVILMGMGLGGFADGIVLHQILQWHHLLSSVVPPTDMARMELNMLWDGIFHAAVWVLTLVGLFVAWAGARALITMPNTAWLGGWLLFGWGLFNFVEGLINHHLLGLHAVRYHGDLVGGVPHMGWQLVFLVVGGIGFMVAGWLIARFGQEK